MKIQDGWQFDDKVSGLRLRVTDGDGLDTLHIEHIGAPIVGNRDFFFDKDGGFDGTGSGVCRKAEVETQDDTGETLWQLHQVDKDGEHHLIAQTGSTQILKFAPWFLSIRNDHPILEGWCWMMVNEMHPSFMCQAPPLPESAEALTTLVEEKIE